MSKLKGASAGGSETIDRLQAMNEPLCLENPIPALSTAIPLAPANAISVICDEHRFLATVMQAWINLFKDARDKDIQPDAPMMKEMVRYIQAFSALHSPKEDNYLFRKLRERTAEAIPELDNLERQHLRDKQQVIELAVLVDRYATGEASVADTEQAVSRYSQAIWEHMGREESVILPLAQRYLGIDDWSEIEEAFQNNIVLHSGGDTDSEFKRLLSHIINHAHASSN